MRSTVLALALLVANTASALVLEVSVVTDYPTVLKYGSVQATEDVIRRVVADASPVFKNQLDIEVRLVYVDIPTTAAEDMLSKDNHPIFLLDNLALYRGNNPAHRSADITVLLTERPLFTGSQAYVGYARTSAVCSSLSVATVRLRDNGLDAQNLAHEMGHVRGAEHDGDTAGPCGSEPGAGYLMSPRTGTGVELFSTCSVNSIKDYTSKYADCLHDPALGSSPRPPATVTTESSGGGGSMEWLSIALLALLAFRRRVLA